MDHLVFATGCYRLISGGLLIDNGNDNDDDWYDLNLVLDNVIHAGI